MRRAFAIPLVAALAAAVVQSAQGDGVPAPAAPSEPATPYVPSVERGYRFIVDKSYIPASFTDAEVDALWTMWPAPLRERAEKASAAERRRMTYERYGLTPRPDDERKPLQYVVDASGAWSINCFACHGGQVAGTTVPGLPNAQFAFQDLIDDVARLAVERKDAVASARVAPWRRLPLGETHGTTNAVVFGVALGMIRSPDLDFAVPKSPPAFVHHDLDAPPWWNVAKKPRLYVDGAATKSHRWLMQFLMVPSNFGSKLRAWEDDFRDVMTYIESLRPPAWPHEVDRPLAQRGRVTFEASCARCHGTYGEGASYPCLAVPIAEVGTDRLRLEAIPRSERERFAKSWFTEYRAERLEVDPVGYVAPPLDGVWASAPYFHNGAAPTLWHVLRPAKRPKAWRARSATGYDRARVGLDVEERDTPPSDLADGWERRAWFDTTKPGKSAAGHPFPDALTDAERRAVLEYLKTL